MTVVLIALLFVNAGFNVLVWPRFYGRVAKDPRARDAEGKATRFLIVHAVLIALALAIALASAIAAIVALVAPGA
ncbi:SCO4848 family membrane protein [Microbacterium sp.]|uniref:SCO4848 family membrane protein n=1 Tax=Microbacterium sp. TaxID=51671 RepID=UPI003C73A28F